ncbi:hypothetical protein RRG08_019568 [Elysia crispata]|uniref:Uncharacterized protein n=1 Tax=Elysia crispata TaxID=231223 RepID=A0AAE1D2X1_9GAST|nr:hypothetical protein RRG08_019568 [Elysia crispata]
MKGFSCRVNLFIGPSAGSASSSSVSIHYSNPSVCLPCPGLAWISLLHFLTRQQVDERSRRDKRLGEEGEEEEEEEGERFKARRSEAGSSSCLS